MDYADKLDMMDDDRDSEGFPQRPHNMDYNSPETQKKVAEIRKEFREQFCDTMIIARLSYFRVNEHTTPTMIEDFFLQKMGLLDSHNNK